MTMGNLLALDNHALPHPCFDEKAKRACGRIHLPVAPGCNIQCGYCSRAFDCVNESRPGVTSSIMEPDQAVACLSKMLTQMPYVTVAGIAGPGDAFCDPERTLTTLEMICKEHPRLNLCLSTNGLDIGPHISELAHLGVGYVTITMNSATAETGSLIYPYVRNGSQMLRGLDGAGFLIGRQLDAIAALKAKKIAVKVNTVVVSRINEGEVEGIARRVSKLGAGIMNIIPAIAVPGTAFEHASPISSAELSALRKRAAVYITQMTHCVRCRADAAGFLDSREEQGPTICLTAAEFGPRSTLRTLRRCG